MAVTTYSVTVKCTNCFWKGSIQPTKGVCIVLTANGYIGFPCTNCNCELLQRDDR